MPSSKAPHSSSIPGLPGAVGLKEVVEPAAPAGRPGRRARGVPGVLCRLSQLDGGGTPGREQVGSDLRPSPADLHEDRDADRAGRGRCERRRSSCSGAHVRQIYESPSSPRCMPASPAPSRVRPGASGPGRAPAPLRNAQSAVAGHFTATLTDRALRWHVRVDHAAQQPATSRILLVGADGKPVPPITPQLRAVHRAGERLRLLTPAMRRPLATGHASSLSLRRGTRRSARSRPVRAAQPYARAPSPLRSPRAPPPRRCGPC